MSLLKKAWAQSLEPSTVDEACDEAARRLVHGLNGRSKRGNPPA